MPGTAQVKSTLTRIEQLLATDPGQANRLAADLLQAVPTNAAARLYQGIALRLLNDPTAAVNVLEPLCQEHPNAPLAHQQLGLAYRETNRTEDALRTLQHTVAVKPDYCDAWLALADLLTESGNREQANAAFLHYAKFSGTDPRLQEALQLMQKHDYSGAESSLREIIRTQPNDIVALCMLAETCENLQLSGESEQLLERCLVLADGYTRARLSYATVLMRHNKIQDALAQTQTVLASESGNPDALKLQAYIRIRMCEYDAAIDIYQQLLSTNKGQADVYTSLGHALRAVGRTGDALDAYRQAIKLLPGKGEAYWNIANIKTVEFQEQELKSMNSQAKNPALPDIDRVHFNFALGKALEDRGDFAESFKYYDTANKLHHKSCQYNTTEFGRYIDRCTDCLIDEFYNQRVDWGATAADPIFILGLPRVGSTLVEQILASHPQVEGTMELLEISTLANSMNSWGMASKNSTYPELLQFLDQNSIQELGETYISQTRIYRKQGLPRFIDKMPENFIHTGLILLILPNASIIDIRRHPMSSGFSLYKQHFASRRDFSYSLTDIAHYYREYVRLMAHFDKVLPGRIHRVHYETLVTDTETEIRRLLDYCQLDFDPMCLEFHKNKRDINTPSSEQVRSPIYASALDAWRNYETWLQPLHAGLGPVIDSYPDIPAL